MAYVHAGAVPNIHVKINFYAFPCLNRGHYMVTPKFLHNEFFLLKIYVALIRLKLLTRKRIIIFLNSMKIA